MERKTIGGFIAALRKANGMTQKDLAERLNISDKTVSRWERDDGTPDLSLIPVIAEIFRVTCDELLRGERKSPQERAEVVEEHETSVKGVKQRQRLLAVGLSRYKTHTFITMGIAAVGLIAAMVGNLGFLRAYIGFFIGAAFYVAAIVAQAVFVNGAFLSVSDESLAGEEVGRFKWTVVRLAEWSIGLTVVIFGFSLPLVCLIDGTYKGMNAGSWFLYGVIFGAVALLIVVAVCYVLNASLLKNGICVLSEREQRCYYPNHALKRRCAIGLTLALLVTMGLHAFGGEMIWSARNLAKGSTFHDYESFVAYMEQDVSYEAANGTYWSGPFTYAEEQAVAPESSAVQEASTGEITYYDQYGNAISEEEALTRTLVDKNGNAVCTYIERNESVSSLRYERKEGTVLPITAISYRELRLAWQRHDLINVAYSVLYPIELIAVLFIYFKKRIK